MEPNQTNAPVSPVEPVAPAEPEAPVVPDGEKKTSKGMVVGMILLVILAIGGVGFGIWAWMDGNARAEDLNKQIVALKTQDNRLLDVIEEYENKDENEIEDEDGKEDEDVEIDVITDTETGVDTDTDVSENTSIDTDVDVNTADYLYAGRWGMKIKVADNLKQVEYALLYGSEDFSRLCVAGLADRASYSYKFGSLYENFPGLACVIRGPSNYKSKDCESTFSLDNHNYCVLSNYLSKYSQTEDEIQLEKDSMKLIVDMLSNPSNYSKI